MRDNGETRPRKADTPSSTGAHVVGQWETMAHNRRQGETGRQEGRQWETIGGTMGDKWRQDPGEADKPHNTGAHVRRQWETSRDKTSGRQTHHPTKENKKGDGRQGRRGDKTAGRRTHHPRRKHQHRHTSLGRQ